MSVCAAEDVEMEDTIWGLAPKAACEVRVDYAQYHEVVAHHQYFCRSVGDEFSVKDSRRRQRRSPLCRPCIMEYDKSITDRGRTRRSQSHSICKMLAFQSGHNFWMLFSAPRVEKRRRLLEHGPRTVLRNLMDFQLN